MKINWFLCGALIISPINGLLHAEFENLRFHKTKDTLSKIQEIIKNKQKGAYLRFGDGEIVIALGQGAIEQHPNQALTLEMREALAMNGPTILKTLPIYCPEFGGFEPGMLPGYCESPYSWCLDMLRKAKPFWNSEIRDVYSHAALLFAANQYPDECIEFLKFLKKSNCCLFIGNQNVPEHIRDLLFGSKCIFIPTAAHSCYRDIDAIERNVLKKIPKDDTYKVIITSMGPTSKALQKRLWSKLDNVFLFDLGSIMDALCGWNTREWIEVTKFDRNAFITKLII